MRFCHACGAAYGSDEWGHDVHPGRCHGYPLPPADPGADCPYCGAWLDTGKGLLNHGRRCTADRPHPPGPPANRQECTICTTRHTPRCPQRGPWPVAPLLAWMPGLEPHEMAARLGCQVVDLTRFDLSGLPDDVADRWATRLRLHPNDVWPGWSDAGLTVVDAQRLTAGGWRHAWLATLIPTRLAVAA